MKHLQLSLFVEEHDMIPDKDIDVTPFCTQLLFMPKYRKTDVMNLNTC